MPQFKTGDMWTAYTTADLFLITTNSTLKTSSHALVMGRGIARQAKERFPGLDIALGGQIQALCGNQGIYGLLVKPALANREVGRVPGEAPLQPTCQPGTHPAQRDRVVCLVC